MLFWRTLRFGTFIHHAIDVEHILQQMLQHFALAGHQNQQHMQKQLIFVWGRCLELTSSWPPAPDEEVPNGSKWLTSGTAGTEGRSGDEFQIIEKHMELLCFLWFGS